ncbi:tripartite tricarboxylate transporter permease [Brevibacterium aurantiacum]|nr:tripartite tricarboxylate transporter permease [Brevibacterium aurantiacum]
MLEAAQEALVAFADPTMLIYLGVGVVVGIVIGVIPGLGGTGAVAVLLPFVFVLEPNQAIAMIIGAVAVVHTSDVITSVVLGIPGSAAASVFLLDGHEMAKKGAGGRALSASFIASMVGGLIGIVALTLVIPIATPLVTSFGSPEIFGLIVMGVFLTALLSKGNIVKGLLVSVFGLGLGLVGVSPVSAEYRYTFGSEFLTDGIGLVAAALGIFGLAEIIDLVAKKTAVSDGKFDLGRGWREGVKDIVRYKGDVLRGSAVGVGVGILPGVGSTAGSWLSYGQAQAFAARKKNSRFGKGDPRGVIAPSAASNGIESGALIPTLLFGVPGAAPFALLLGVLLIFGIQPGPTLITNDLDLVYFIVWAFAIASVFGAALSFFLARPLARLSFVSFPLLAATLIPVLFLSGFQEPLNLSVFYLMFLLGIIGWICKVANIPRAPFLIAFVLAEPLERYYFLTINAFPGGEWAMRPIVLIIAGILAASVVIPLFRNRKRKSVETFEPSAVSVSGQKPATNYGFDTLSGEAGGATTSSSPTSDAEDSAPEHDIQMSEKSDMPVPGFVELLVSGLALAFFIATVVLAVDFSSNGRLFPLAVGIVGILLALFSVFRDALQIRKFGFGRFDDMWQKRLKIVGLSALWILGYIWVVFVLGMLIGSGLFTFVFLLAVARTKILTALIYSGCLFGVLWLLVEFAQLVAPTGYFF